MAMAGNQAATGKAANNGVVLKHLADVGNGILNTIRGVVLHLFGSPTEGLDHSEQFVGFFQPRRLHRPGKAYP